jgi:hypothetical protein
LKAEDLSFNLLCWALQSPFFRISSYLVFGPYLLYVAKLCLPSVNLDHGGGSGILRRIFLRFWQMRAFWKDRDHPRRLHKATPVSQVVLVVRETTSCAALTGVANLDATQEVNETNIFYYKLTNTAL